MLCYLHNKIGEIGNYDLANKLRHNAIVIDFFTKLYDNPFYCHNANPDEVSLLHDLLKHQCTFFVSTHPQQSKLIQEEHHVICPNIELTEEALQEVANMIVNQVYTTEIDPNDENLISDLVQTQYSNKNETERELILQLTLSILTSHKADNVKVSLPQSSLLVKQSLDIESSLLVKQSHDIIDKYITLGILENSQQKGIYRILDYKRLIEKLSQELSQLDLAPKETKEQYLEYILIMIAPENQITELFNHVMNPHKLLTFNPQQFNISETDSQLPQQQLLQSILPQQFDNDDAQKSGDTSAIDDDFIA
jgi:hypothetical protein